MYFPDTFVSEKYQKSIRTKIATFYRLVSDLSKSISPYHKYFSIGLTFVFFIFIFREREEGFSHNEKYFFLPKSLKKSERKK